MHQRSAHRSRQLRIRNQGTQFQRGFEPLEDRTLLTASYQPPQQFLFAQDGYLTGPSNASPIAIAENYLRNSASQLGILVSDIDNYIVTRNYVTQTTGATTLTFQQSFGGLPVFNANYNMTVAADGRLLAVGGGFVPGLSQKTSTIMPVFGAQQAVLEVAKSVGINQTELPLIVEQDGYSFKLSAAGISLDEIGVELWYVPVAGNDVALSWELTVRTPDGRHWFNASVDTDNGAINSTVSYLSDATYEVFPSPSRNPNDAPRSVATDPDIFLPTPAPVPSPFGWHDTDGVAGAEFTITSGNNVNAYADRNADDQPDLNSQPDGGATLDFTGVLVPVDPTQQPDTYTAASVVNLFYWSNILHDVHYLYGFDEAAGNFQVNNYGRGGLGGDAVQAETQDGSGTNNANFATPPDGTPPRMQMYEFTLSSPRRDSSFENEIIIHEYGHGVSNRLTGNGAGLFNLQSRGMGEGWSDFWSLMLTQKSASETTTGRGVGTYVLNQPLDGIGIRDFRYDFDITNLQLETFLNYGTGPGQSVFVHDAGTRWNAALWDINHLLTERYGFESNVYNSTSLAGNIRTMHLVMNALKLQPLNPTFMQARDAILAADELLYGGAHKLELWTAFARRGLRHRAQTANSNAPSITTSFELPANLQLQASAGPDVSVVEGDSGTVGVVFSVSLSFEVAVGEDPVTVAYTTVDGTALAGSDYAAVSGTLTFQPGAPATQTVTVQVFGDQVVEANETFLLRITEVSEGLIGDAEAVATILNDDVDLSVSDVIVAEGNSGTRNAVFTVTAFGDANRPITFSYSTLNGTAQSGSDYLPQAGVIALPSGNTSTQITVTVLGDRIDEDNETFFLALTGAQGARIADAFGQATIVDEDPLPSLYVSDAQVTTTTAGTYQVTFSVALDVASGRQVNVNYSTADFSAIAGVDYIAKSGVLSFAPGVTNQLVTVDVMTSGVPGANKRFSLNMTGVSNADLGDSRGDCYIVYADQPQNEFIIDNGAAGYSRSFTGWTTLTNTLAYHQDYDYASAGNGSAVANWTFTAIPNGTYQIFTRWSHFGNRATNAPFTVYSGLGGNTAVGTTLVNQQLAPVGDFSNGVAWQSIGTFEVTANTLRVRLTNAANGYVVGDAIRIVGGGIGFQSGEIDVHGFGRSIATGDVSPSPEDATDFGAVPSLGVTIERTFTITNNGNADLVLTGNPFVAMGGPHTADFTITQMPAPVIAPGGKSDFKIAFRATDVGFRTATVSIANTDDSENPFEFVVQGYLAPAAAALAHNSWNPQDVNDDGRVNTSDALMIINHLLTGPAAAPLVAGWTAEPLAAPSVFYDVVPDGRVNTSDLLSIFNRLLTQAAAAQPLAAQPLVAQPLAGSVADEAMVLFDLDQESSEEPIAVAQWPVAVETAIAARPHATALLFVEEDDLELASDEEIDPAAELDFAFLDD